MSSPLISVVVSTHAAERHIRGCLEMLLRQTVADRLEIIVIDSGSPELERVSTHQRAMPTMFGGSRRRP